MDMKSHRGVDLPVFQETLKQYENLSFLRDDKGRWITEIPETGWYQDRAGKLYKYDGVIWDEVPEVRVSELEYLG
jgi:hypothetical protein